MPVSPKVLPANCPEVAISTAPGGLSDGSQQSMVLDEVVLGICGLAHQVAALRDTPSSTEDTICQGGTCSPEGLEINCTPVERVSCVNAVLVDWTPSFVTKELMSAGPPFLMIWTLWVSVTTLAFCRAVSTMATSPLVSLRAKKCWLTSTSLSRAVQPSVLPSSGRG